MGQCLPDLAGTHVRRLPRETVVEPGEHLAGKPVFATHIAGRMNIDTLVVDLPPLRVEPKLGRDQDRDLLSRVQSMLKEHEVSGELLVEASGLVQANDWRASNLKAPVTLTGGNVAAGDHHLSVDRLQALWTLVDRRGAPLVACVRPALFLKAWGPGVKGAAGGAVKSRLTALRMRSARRLIARSG